MRTTFTLSKVPGIRKGLHVHVPTGECTQVALEQGHSASPERDRLPFPAKAAFPQDFGGTADGSRSRPAKEACGPGRKEQAAHRGGSGAPAPPPRPALSPQLAQGPAPHSPGGRQGAPELGQPPLPPPYPHAAPGSAGTGGGTRYPSARRQHPHPQAIPGGGGSSHSEGRGGGAGPETLSGDPGREPLQVGDALEEGGGAPRAQLFYDHHHVALPVAQKGSPAPTP